jgi:glutamine synthetase
MNELQRKALRVCKQEGVRFVEFWFTDVLGQLKALSVPAVHLAAALEEGVAFDGSSIEGFACIHDSDIIAMPDASTFQVLPWTKDSIVTARMFCDVVTTELEPYAADPRQVLRRTLALYKKRGITANMGPELEYFYLAGSKSAELTDSGGYFDLAPLDVAAEIRMKTVLTLEVMGTPVHASHHEVAASQHELDLYYGEALKIADAIMTAKLVIKEVARTSGVYATFMPKPFKGQNGVGMHVHQSLFKNGKNAFYSRSDRDHLSDLARHYIAGLLKHSKEIALVTNQWVNSYKRLVPGFEAPAYICWGSRNRSTLVRVPLDRPEHEVARRVELRSPDPACNPYLVFAVMLRAGLEGIEKKYPLPDPMELDVYAMSSRERQRRGIDTLPDSLQAAIEETAGSKFMRETLGDALFEKLLELKRAEWDAYRTQVTDYELARYLPIL